MPQLDPLIARLDAEDNLGPTLRAARIEAQRLGTAIVDSGHAADIAMRGATKAEDDYNRSLRQTTELAKQWVAVGEQMRQAQAGMLGGTAEQMADAEKLYNSLLKQADRLSESMAAQANKRDAIEQRSAAERQRAEDELAARMMAREQEVLAFHFRMNQQKEADDKRSEAARLRDDEAFERQRQRLASEAIQRQIQGAQRMADERAASAGGGGGGLGSGDLLSLMGMMSGRLGALSLNMGQFGALMGMSAGAALGLAAALMAVNKGLEMVGAATDFVADQVKKFIQVGFEQNRMIRDVTASYATWIGNTEEAAKTIEDLILIANRTPFDNPTILKLGQDLLAAQRPATELSADIIAIGNVAASYGVLTADVMGRVGYAIMQVGQVGHLTAEEARQLKNAGVPALEAVARAYNMTGEEAKQAMAEGRVSTEAFLYSMRALAAERAPEGMANRMKTLGGAFEAIQSNIATFSAKGMEPLFKLMERGAVAIANFTMGDDFMRQQAAFQAAMQAVADIIEKQMLPALAKMADDKAWQRMAQAGVVALKTVGFAAVELGTTFDFLIRTTARWVDLTVAGSVAVSDALTAASRNSEENRNRAAASSAAFLAKLGEIPGSMGRDYQAAVKDGKAVLDAYDAAVKAFRAPAFPGSDVGARPNLGPGDPAEVQKAKDAWEKALADRNQVIADADEKIIELRRDANTRLIQLDYKYNQDLADANAQEALDRQAFMDKVDGELDQHNKNRKKIADDAAKDEKEARKKATEGIAEENRSYQADVEKQAVDHTDRLVEIERNRSQQLTDFRQRALDQASKLADQMADIDSRRADAARDADSRLADSRFDTASKLADKLKDLAEKNANQILDIEERHRVKRQELVEEGGTGPRARLELMAALAKDQRDQARETASAQRTQARETAQAIAKAQREAAQADATAAREAQQAKDRANREASQAKDNAERENKQFLDGLARDKARADADYALTVENEGKKTAADAAELAKRHKDALDKIQAQLAKDLEAIHTREAEALQAEQERFVGAMANIVKEEAAREWAHQREMERMAREHKEAILNIEAEAAARERAEVDRANAALRKAQAEVAKAGGAFVTNLGGTEEEQRRRALSFLQNAGVLNPSAQPTIGDLTRRNDLQIATGVPLSSMADLLAEWIIENLKKAEKYTAPPMGAESTPNYTPPADQFKSPVPASWGLPPGTTMADLLNYSVKGWGATGGPTAGMGGPPIAGPGIANYGTIVIEAPKKGEDEATWWERFRQQVAKGG